MFQGFSASREWRDAATFLLPPFSCPHIGPGPSLTLTHGRTLLHLGQVSGLGLYLSPERQRLPVHSLLRDSVPYTCPGVLWEDLRAELCSIHPALCPPACNVLLPVLFVGAVPCLGLAVAAVAFSLLLSRCCSAVWYLQGPGLR